MFAFAAIPFEVDRRGGGGSAILPPRGSHPPTVRFTGEGADRRGEAVVASGHTGDGPLTVMGHTPRGDSSSDRRMELVVVGHSNWYDGSDRAVAKSMGTGGVKINLYR